MMVEQKTYKVNGVSLRTYEAGTPGQPLILFLHGFPEMGQAWYKQLYFFAENGFHAVAPDQRGYNKSSKPNGVKSYNLKFLTSDIAGLIEQLTTDKVYLVGHDWGGAVAWAMALNCPEIIEKVIILNMPHPVVMHEHLLHNSNQRRRSWYAGFFQIPFLPEWLSRVFNYRSLEKTLVNTALPNTFPKEQLELYKTAWRQPGALTAMINWYRAYKYNLVTTTDLITVPTLLLWGKKDAFLITEMAQPSIDQCRNGKLKFINEATHWLHHEKPDLINQSILAFIQSPA
ncbi:alpha/beta fold hydrolase [Adhaeribacter radiodurans]|uniref:Alpha/beta hydrolase n=1 Tax=Adhaeribacter radiodurans TaxID=2745197 RepID=A0A7L7L4C4_9BACT|nr:alpha/beta hydrolase [Adhaeribacter radiodurans]QMU27623.1 alpha/beta hydrolase [Adhaeribacter radiodurans]